MTNFWTAVGLLLCFLQVGAEACEIQFFKGDLGLLLLEVEIPENSHCNDLADVDTFRAKMKHYLNGGIESLYVPKVIEYIAPIGKPLYIDELSLKKVFLEGFLEVPWTFRGFDKYGGLNYEVKSTEITLNPIIPADDIRKVTPYYFDRVSVNGGFGWSVEAFFEKERSVSVAQSLKSRAGSLNRRGSNKQRLDSLSSVNRHRPSVSSSSSHGRSPVLQRLQLVDTTMAYTGEPMTFNRDPERFEGLRFQFHPARVDLDPSDWPAIKHVAEGFEIGLTQTDIVARANRRPSTVVNFDGPIKLFENALTSLLSQAEQIYKTSDPDGKLYKVQDLQTKITFEKKDGPTLAKRWVSKGGVQIQLQTRDGDYVSKGCERDVSKTLSPLTIKF